MNKKIILLFILYLLSNKAMAQVDIENSFYKFSIPKKTNVKLFKSTHEELANIDSYQFIFEAKPKYILYLMSNKITSDIKEINIDNYKDFLYDLGEIKISNIEKTNGVVKLHFKYNENDAIQGVLFISINNDVLDRFLFLLPNESAYKSFNTEIDDVVKNIKHKKNKW
jgi:hypothetical protein